MRGYYISMKGLIPIKHQMAGQAAVLATACLWSTAGFTFKLLPWHPVIIAGSRCLLAGIFLFVVRIIIPPPKIVKSDPFSLWASALAYSLAMITFIAANKLTTSANAVMLQYSAPVWAALLGWLLIKEKPYWEHWGALVLIIFGLLLFFRDSLGSGAFLGDSIAVISGVLFGAQSVFMRMMKDGNPRDAFLLAHIITFFISIPFFFLYPPVLTTVMILPVLYMGLIQIGLASLLFSYGIKRISAVKAMLTAIIEPVLNPLWVLLLTGEKPTVSAIAGGIIIISAVVTSSVIGKRREELLSRIAKAHS